MKKNKKIFKIIILFFIFLYFISINNVVNAASSGIDWDDIINGGRDFIETGKNGLSNNIANASDTEVQSIIDNIYSILFPLGVAITVIIGGVLGIKFMLASVEEKAKIKEMMVPYVIGCAVIYGAFGIWRVVIEIFSILG